MKRLVIILATILLCLPAAAQVDRREVRSGNRKFARGNVQAAEIDYRKAVLKDSTSVAGNYNLASALYRQEDYEGADKSLQSVKEQASAGRHASDYHYNAGDVALQKKDYAAAVEAFKQSLLINPGDLDAKENYIYAKKMLENQQNNGGGGQNNQDNQDNQDNQNNQNQQNNQDQQDQQDQQDNQNNQDNQDQQNDPENQEGNNEQPQSGISRQQAQQMLNAVQAQEKKTQEKVEKEKAALMQSSQKEKDW